MTWTSEELTRIGNAEVLEVSSRRGDGTLRPYVTIWVVRADRDLYIRSAYGPDNPWFRRARASGAGRIRAGGVERDVTFESPSATSTPQSTPPTTPSTTATDPPSSVRSSANGPRPPSASCPTSLEGDRQGRPSAGESPGEPLCRGTPSRLRTTRSTAFDTGADTGAS